MNTYSRLFVVADTVIALLVSFGFAVMIFLLFNIGA